MPLIASSGDPVAPLWVLLDTPFSTDVPRGFLCSGGMGHALQKMFEEAGLQPKDIYYTCRRPDTDNPMSYSSIEQRIEQYKPQLLLAVGEIAQYFLEECKPTGKEDWKKRLNKQVGSLLSSAKLSYPHYMMPLLPIEAMMIDYQERNIATYVDIGKIREELFWLRAKGTLQPLPQRILLAHEMSTDEVLSHLDAFGSAAALSIDIETMYPKKGSEYYQKHPGLPIVLGIASSPSFGISFSPWRLTPSEDVAIWRALFALLSEAWIIGQNFFLFDSRFLGAIGFTLRRERFHDTLIRHHILWPELSHKLQFMTRQYARERYYKDEAAGWSAKNLDRLRLYNAKDAAITYEVFLEQEKEFEQRPHLRGEKTA